MMKYLTLVSASVSGSVLALLLTTFTVSAQALDEAEMELNQQEMEQQILQVSDWFQDQGYFRSNLMLAVTVLSQQKRPPVDKVLEILNAGIDSKQLQKSDWYRLVRFCEKAHLKKKFVRAGGARAENSNLLVTWCAKNDIVNQFIKRDAENAYAYLLQLDFSGDNRYTRVNQRLLEKAAAAKYARDYFGYGLQAYTTHLREYYRAHPVEPFILPVGLVLEDFSEGAEGMFVTYYSASTVATHMAFSNRILGYCNRSPRELQPGYDDKTVLECIRLMKLFRSDKNTLMDNRVANGIIASLSPSGSDEQLEAKRLKITNGLALECLATWGDPANAEVSFMAQFEIYLKMPKLFESMGELQAMAVASDQYYTEHQNKDAPKPSSCLLLKNLSLDAAEALSATKK